MGRAFLRFARNEARGRSDLYERFATAVAQRASLLRLIAALPRDKRQPNLVLAAARHVCGTIGDPDAFIDAVVSSWSLVQDVVLARSTQTNEPGRCAVLLPLLCALPQPLALLEVGASAGLCLFPDRYGYRFDEEHRLGDSEAPVFPCTTSGAGEPPSTLPEVVWRAGLDVSPVDLADPSEVGWLRTLVWPGEVDRLARLDAAIRIAMDEPQAVRPGDLRFDLQALAEEAPAEATLVVFHTAVLAYLTRQRERDAFAEQVIDLGATWVSNEAASVFPWITDKLERPPPPDRFVLAMNGEPIALTGPHGQSIEWI